MADEQSQEQQGQIEEMSFWDHLEELRKRIILAVVGIIVACIITGIFSDEIMKGLLLPAAHTNPPVKIINLRPYGFLAIYMQVILIAGVILSLPFTLYQFWRFVAPGLKANERRWVRWITFYTSLCFLAGIAFAFFVALPSMLTFFAGFTPSSQVDNVWSINEYLSTIVGAITTGGIIFELPMVCFFLGKIGILTPSFMRHYRRHAIVVILIVAALVTPTPDPLTQLIFAFPLWFLYEVSIFVVAAARKKKVAADTAA